MSIDVTREVLGTAVGDSELFEFWREFLASLKARGLTGVHLVIFDTHTGLKATVAQQFAGSSWQRCREAKDAQQVTRRDLFEVSMDGLRVVIAEKTAAATPAEPHQIAYRSTRLVDQKA